MCDQVEIVYVQLYVVFELDWIVGVNVGDGCVVVFWQMDWYGYVCCQFVFLEKFGYWYCFFVYEGMNEGLCFGIVVLEEWCGCVECYMLYGIVMEIVVLVLVVVYCFIDIVQFQNCGDYEFVVEVVVVGCVVIDQCVEVIVLYSQKKFIDLKIEVGCCCKMIFDVCDVYVNFCCVEFLNLFFGWFYFIIFDSQCGVLIVLEIILYKCCVNVKVRLCGVKLNWMRGMS